MYKEAPGFRPGPRIWSYQANPSIRFRACRRSNIRESSPSEIGLVLMAFMLYPMRMASCQTELFGEMTKLQGIV